MGRNKTMRMASMRESQDSDRFIVNTQVQSHALLHRGFGTFITSVSLDYLLTLALCNHPHCAITGTVQSSALCNHPHCAIIHAVQSPALCNHPHCAITCIVQSFTLCNHFYNVTVNFNVSAYYHVT